MSDHDEKEMKRANRNIKSILIEPFKQIKFGFYVIGVSVTFVLICGGMYVYAFMRQYEQVMNIFKIVEPSLQYEMLTNEVFIENGIKIGILFIGYIVVLFAIIFRLTHRYYGPLISVERFVEEITAGKYEKRAKIREKDELQRLVSRLNNMADALEKRHGNQKLCQCALKKDKTDLDREAS